MENKVFDISKENGKIKIQIGNDKYTLDEQEKNRLAMLFTKIKETRVLFPAGLEGVCIMYDNGLIAANINISKLHLTGTNYIILIYSLKPCSDKYEVNKFIISSEILDNFLEVLSN